MKITDVHNGVCMYSDNEIMASVEKSLQRVRKSASQEQSNFS